jgi:hypothetical protein
LNGQERTPNVNQAIGEVTGKIAEVEKWPNADKTSNLKKQLRITEKNIKSMLYLHTLQKAAKAEFSTNYVRGSSTGANFKENQLGLLRQCVWCRLVRKTTDRAGDRQKIIDAAESDGYGLLMANRDSLANESAVIARTVGGAPGEDLGNIFLGVEDRLRVDNRVKFSVADMQNDAGAPSLDVTMTSSDKALPRDWGHGLTIEGGTGDFHMSKCLENLKKIPQHGNAYARTFVSVIGSLISRGSIFDGVEGFEDTFRTKKLSNPTPYAICGLGDLNQFVAFNEIFKSLQSPGPARTNSLRDLNIEKVPLVIGLNSLLVICKCQLLKRFEKCLMNFPTACKDTFRQLGHLRNQVSGSGRELRKRVALN